MSDRSSIFDMIGPVMIGPSSSHTAGVVRIGRVARRILGAAPEEVVVTFYNSFARTYEGHGSDRAIIAGLLDFKTDDDRIKNALNLAPEMGLSYKFRAVANASALHPNSVRVKMKAGDKTGEVLGVSRGGGLISIREVNGFHCNFSAQAHTLLIQAKDVRGSIAMIANVVSNEGSNIGTMTVDRQGKDQTAFLVLEMDSGLSPLTVQYLSHLNWIQEVQYIPDIDL